MNALELADMAENACCAYYKEIAAMLRQQQAEIELLKKDNKELHAIAQRMAMAESDARKSLQNIKDYATTSTNTSEEPIITWKLEAKFKELTDEEINWLAKAYSTMEGKLNAPAFAKAILRKAQEK